MVGTNGLEPSTSSVSRYA